MFSGSLGESGVPFSKIFHLNIDFISLAGSTQVRLGLNGSIYKILTVPYEIELSKNKFISGNIGADLDGSNGAAFDLLFWSVTNVVLSEEKRLEFYKITGDFVIAKHGSGARLTGGKYMTIGEKPRS